MKCLVVNADDFGLSDGINRGIIEAHERGIVTSTSLMVHGEAVQAAVVESRPLPGLSLGLHIDLGEWLFHNGNWTPLYERVSLDDPKAVNREIEHQFEMFAHMVGRIPTHLDSHQHVHLREPAFSVARRLAEEWSIPLRRSTQYIRFRGEFYGQTDEGSPLPDILRVEYLLDVLASIDEGVTELSCHPGYGDELNTMYRNERRREISILCDPRIRQGLRDHGIELCSFGDERVTPNFLQRRPS